MATVLATKKNKYMNNYIEQSKLFLREVSKRIQVNLSDFEVIQTTLLLAIGLERLLKGILFDVNPVYILIEPDFKHSMQTVYSQKIITELKTGSKELASSPNPDVITFRNSLLRSQHVSRAVFLNKNILFAISDYRDIIVHYDLSILDISKCKETLLRDYYPLLYDICKELDINQYHIFKGNHIRLAKISSDLQGDLNKRISLLLESHKDKFIVLKGNLGYIADKDKITNGILLLENKDPIKCPACSNTAIIFKKPIYEFYLSTKSEEITGYEIKTLKCWYCKLEVNDPKILDYLGVLANKELINKEPIDSDFGSTEE